MHTSAFKARIRMAGNCMHGRGNRMVRAPAERRRRRERRALGGSERPSIGPLAHSFLPSCSLASAGRRCKGILEQLCTLFHSSARCFNRPLVGGVFLSFMTRCRLAWHAISASLAMATSSQHVTTHHTCHVPAPVEFVRETNSICAAGLVAINENFVHAAGHGRVKDVVDAISNGQDVNYQKPPRNDSALMYASYYGHVHLQPAAL